MGKLLWDILVAPLAGQNKAPLAGQGEETTVRHGRGACKWKTEFWDLNGELREAPIRLAAPLFGHCPNSDYTLPPALKRALWGTFFPGRFEQIFQITVLTVHKCTKHPGKP